MYTHIVFPQSHISGGKGSKYRREGERQKNKQLKL